MKSCRPVYSGMRMVSYMMQIISDFTANGLSPIGSGLLSPLGIKRAHAPASVTPLAVPLATFTLTQPLSLLS